MRATGMLVKRAGRLLLDALLPPLCLACARYVREPQSLCGTCWSSLNFLAAPQCSRCGYPFPHDLGAGVQCAACLARPPAFARARSALAYDDASRGLLLGFKNGDRLEAAPLFGRWLLACSGDMMRDVDVIVPVPIHWWRLVMRRYNQAAVLGGSLAGLSRVPLDVRVLERPRHGVSQGNMPSARARLRNVAGAFRVRPGAAARVSGRHVLLIDDVLTTGATVTACAKALRRAGARDVSVVTLARVVRPLRLPGSS